MSAVLDDEIRGSRRIVSVMGTVFSVDVRDLALDSEAVDRVVGWWRWVDATFSTYRSDSQVVELGDGRRGLEDCAVEVRDVLALCRDATEASDGYFTAEPGGRLDPTGLVKGWSVEVASRMLHGAGSRVHCIAAGGDLRSSGSPAPGRPWRLGVVDPFDRTRVAAVVVGHDLAVATSGTAERGPHIVDPVRRRPATELASVTLVGADLTHVDAMATAVFAMGERCRTWLARRPDLGALVVGADGRAWVQQPCAGARIEVC
ncbi:Thiamine biosynthesis lipoprotein ApbE precursor [Nocardioides dokdonensis FR1436]|uniref:FAD:protein FMN transferase n=1 Tax=Nocardioides dokdonensis FR1436 TaxID=1300347 RepID=A0A1A9GQ74_9ACTN|nr:FAD:protein FMN transferase [Nocardioides dokdonensis]ANH40464.1 Thiamine biosynthesis lipoprotein ApbE precursor [Nocardioides dokdonensis FR1436]